MSKGLGLSWLNDNEDNVLRDLGVRRKGKIIRAPRYYMNKLGDKVELDRLNLKTLEASADRREVMQRLSIDALEEWKREEDVRKQTDLDQRALFERRKGKF